MNTKGQLSIVNILFFVIILGFAVVVTPVAQSFIDASITANNITGISALIMNAIVPFMWLGILATLFIYIAPVGQVRQF